MPSSQRDRVRPNTSAGAPTPAGQTTLLMAQTWQESDSASVCNPGLSSLLRKAEHPITTVAAVRSVIALIARCTT
jgi:hypothetical protein